jgi:hypothetical protein
VTLSLLTATITGGSGNDTITRTTTTADSIAAGAGNDSVVFSSLTATDTVDGGAGTDKISGTSANLVALTALTTPLITNFETIVVSDALGASLTAASVQAGITQIDLAAGSGAFGLVLEAGAKTVRIAAANTGSLTVTDTGTAATDTLAVTNYGAAIDMFNAAGGLITVGFETVTVTGTGTGTATSQDATLFTMTADTGGTTTLKFTGSNSFTSAGAITANVIDASGLTSSAVLTMAAAGSSITSITGGGSGDTLIGDTSSYIDGAAGNDTITGGSLNDTLIGGTGDDQITNGSGGTTDSVSGGTGNDTVIAVLVSGNTITGGDGTDILSLAAAATAITATGVSGFETLTDTVGIVQDMAVFLDNSTFTRINFSTGTANFTNVGTNVATLGLAAAGTAYTFDRLIDSSTNSLAVSVTTGVTVASLTANDEETISISSTSTGAVVFTASAQTDLTTLTLTGAGNITITPGASPLATVNASAMTASAIVDATATTANVTMTGSSTVASTLTGGIGADSITGGSGVDSITGGVGADTLVGGDGADVFRIIAVDTGIFTAGLTSTTASTMDKLYVVAGDTVSFTTLVDTAATLDTLSTLVTSNVTALATAITAANGMRIQGYYNATTDVFTAGSTNANSVLFAIAATVAGTTATDSVILVGVTDVTSLTDAILTI